MRVFYEDESDTPVLTKKTYYVKLINPVTSIIDNDTKWDTFQAISTRDLIAQINEFYTFDRRPELEIQLWSINRPRKRLDNLKEIPYDIEYLYAKVE